MNLTWIIAICGLCVGFLLQILLRAFLRWSAKKHAEKYAKDLLDTAQVKAEEILGIAKESSAEYERTLIEQNEKDFAQREEKNQKLQSQVDRLKNQLHNKWTDKKRATDKSSKGIQDHCNLIDAKEAKFRLKVNGLQKQRKDFSDTLFNQFSLNKDEFLAEISSKLVNQFRTQLTETLENEELLLKDHSEREAKRIIDIVLSRFLRPYCAERGIGFIILKSDKDVQKMLGPDKANIELVEEICGVDVIYNERVKSLSVSGFDPVRRELGRATLEKLARERHVNEKVIRETVENCKKRLFKKIKTDGHQISKELKLDDLNIDIKNMLGALRYRYSFTQNQYFHCAEVGHVCGLLAAEMGVDINDARRAGLLHDIGKAMDHSLDGGHAVIGAEFIEKHGESSKVVHAVKAHHFDETPATNLAYLVIAADAVSGARPGARRSTTSTYVQKMNQLQEIGNSFKGVKDTFILSAGREVRITVDSKNIDDYKALELSKEIAKKIEQDCNYPGTIKVTVVRESQAVEMAR